jgi:thiol-disulfide isomerase/thioredoxin
MTRGLRIFALAAGGIVAAAALLGAYALSRAQHGGADVRVIAHGDRVDIQAHAVLGKYTVFDFYAVWCPPCRALSPALEKLASRNTGSLAIRKVDIVDWTMPVAEQYGIEELPYLVLFDGSGRKVADGEAVFDELGRLFGDAALDVGRATEKPPAGTM